MLLPREYRVDIMQYHGTQRRTDRQTDAYNCLAAHKSGKARHMHAHRPIWRAYNIAHLYSIFFNDLSYNSGPFGALLAMVYICMMFLLYKCEWIKFYRKDTQTLSKCSFTIIFALNFTEWPLSWFFDPIVVGLVIYQDGLSVHRQSPFQVITGPGVEQLRWSRSTR